MERRKGMEKVEIPLTKLKDGESGNITSIKLGQGLGWRGGGRGRGFKRRLVDMGLTPGTRITVVKSAPLRGPLEVSLRGSRLALGRGTAEKIFVEKEE